MSENNKKKKAKRVRLIQSMMTAFMRHVYLNQEEKKLVAMGEIAQKNQALQNLPYAAFMFNRKWYTNPPNLQVPCGMPMENRKLHVSLRGEVYAITQKESFEEVEIRSKIQDSIGKALQYCRTIGCLKQVLPDAVFSVLPTDTWLLFDEGTPLTEEEIEAFKENNLEGLSALKTLYMRELLLAKV